MPVTKSVGGPTIITPAVNLNTLDGQVSGATRDADWAVTEQHDPSIQLQVNLGEAAPGATIVFKAPTDATGTIELTLPDASGTLATGTGGDVTGPASSTDNTVPRFDGTTGKLLQGSGVLIDDDGTFRVTGSIVVPTVVYTTDLRINGSGSQVLDLTNRILKDSGGATILDFSSGAAMGASGSFTSQDGKTVTVVNGLITSIV